MDMKKILAAFDNVSSKPVAGFDKMKRFISIIKENSQLTQPNHSVAEATVAQKCWPGHRKVGTKPGTGKNAGKPVNRCKKVGEDESVQDDNCDKKKEGIHNGLAFKDYFALEEAKKRISVKQERPQR